MATSRENAEVAGAEARDRGAAPGTEARDWAAAPGTEARDWGAARRADARDWAAAPGTEARDWGAAPGADARDWGAAPGADADGRPADPEGVARQICLRLLATAPRTRAQLAGALRRRGVPQDAAEAVLGRFAEVGLIDDATFASAWVESRHHGRGLSGRALAAELRTRGVPADDIRAAVGGLDPEQEVATARSLVTRRLAAARGEPAPVRVRRLIGVLARKGYPPALAYRLVREALEQEGLDLAAAGLDLSEPPGEPEDEEPR